MAFPNIFTTETTEAIISRINQLTPESSPKWGKMSVAQMLAHCNVTYEMVYENIHPEPNFLMKLILKAFVKKKVTDDKPFTQNMPTAPAFIIKDSKNFMEEKARLTNHIKKTQQLGETAFDNKKSLSFGPLKSTEWNNMFYKHLDHHLKQFGV